MVGRYLETETSGQRGAQSQGTHRVSPATERLVSTMKIKTKIKAGAVYQGTWD